jgi:1-acyl-sn-glycerol-3-phosphate acyltransferase
VKRPNPIVNLTLGGLASLLALSKGQRFISRVKIKEPAIVLINHCSFSDFYFTQSAIYPSAVNFMAASKMFYQEGRGFWLRLSRSIPKHLFQPDVYAVKNALEILNDKKGIIGIYPEGQISPIGKVYPLPKSIAKFVKKAKVNVYVIKHYNTYLALPPWSEQAFNGPIFTEMTHILTPEEIESKDVEAIYETIQERIYFNTAKFNKEKKYRYKLKDIDGLDKVIFMCPKCQFEGLKTNNGSLVCPTCNHTLPYNEYGQIGDYDLDDLFEWQKQQLADRIDKNPNFEFKTKVNLETIVDNQRIDIVGSGTLAINRDFYHYQGTYNEQTVEFKFPTNYSEYLAGDLGFNMQLYDGYKLYQFAVFKRHESIKLIIIGEYMYQLAKRGKVK